MKAQTIEEFCEQPDFILKEDIPLSAILGGKEEPAEHQVLVKLKAASVNPVDYKTRAGAMSMVFSIPKPYCILGKDGSGIVEKVKLLISHQN